MKKTVLVMDDEQILVRAHTRVLKNDYNVIVATTIEEGLKLLEFADVVVMDWHFAPEERTSEVVLDNAAMTPVIVYTGSPNDVPDDIGVDVILKKGDVSAEQFLSAVAQVLDPTLVIGGESTLSCPNCDAEMNQKTRTEWVCPNQSCGYEDKR